MLMGNRVGFGRISAYRMQREKKKVSFLFVLQNTCQISLCFIHSAASYCALICVPPAAYNLSPNPDKALAPSATR